MASFATAEAAFRVVNTGNIVPFSESVKPSFGSSTKGLSMSTNFFVSYDLNGKTPTHAQMDIHLKKLGGARILETVWYVRAASLDALFRYVNQITSTNDRVLVIEANNAHVRNTLIPLPNLQRAWAA